MKKLLIALFVVAASLILVSPVAATWGLEEGIDGYVYTDGVPVAGITVTVRRVDTGDLEGFSVDEGTLGTDTTDSNGYYHIAWLEGLGTEYYVTAFTPVGPITAKVTSCCGTTVRWDFCYHVPTLGYWRHEFNAWINKDGLSHHEDFSDLEEWVTQLGSQYDLDGNGDVTILECQTIYNSVEHKGLWHQLTYDLNSLAGYI